MCVGGMLNVLNVYVLYVLNACVCIYVKCISIIYQMHVKLFVYVYINLDDKHWFKLD